ncbi:MAG: hypothetical protein WC285_00335 [Candidatus Gracilibacteria bacterium]
MSEQNSKSLSVVLAVVITAVVVGGGMYWWQTSRALTADTQVAEFNCKQSGGSYSDSECDCSAVGGEYENSTGYCITEIGTPGGELGETAKKLLELEMLKNQ